MVGKLTSDAKLSGSKAPVLMGEAHPSFGDSRNDLMAQVLNAQGKGNYQTSQFTGSEPADWGNELESTIIRKAVERLGIDKYDDEVTEVYSYGDMFSVSLDGILFNPDPKIISSSPGIILMNGQDRMGLVGNGIIESKLTSAPYTEVPPPYRGPWQLQMQMLSYGCDWGVIATLYQGTRLVLNVYEANKEQQSALIEAAEDFYSRLDGPDWYPAMDGADASRTYGNGEDDLPPVDLEPIADIALEYYEARRAAKATEAYYKSLEPALMDHMAKHENAFLNDENGERLFEVKWPTRTTKPQPEKIIPAKPGKVERQRSLTISAKWMGDDE